MEACVAAQLSIHRIEFYYPTIQSRPVNPRSRKITPFFPGYLFVHLDLESTNTAVLKWIPGTVGLVKFDNNPAHVPDGIIAAIRHRVQKLGCSVNSDFHFESGEAVRVMEGPFAGLRGVFDLNIPGNKRARILLEVLSECYKPVKLPIRYIRPIKQS
jgi:transcriptional antiterminator RfaH